MAGPQKMVGKTVPTKDADEATRERLKALEGGFADEMEKVVEGVESAKVDFGELTAECVTVGDITIPIPSALADDIIKNHLPDVDLKKLKTVAEATRASWGRVTKIWWILDHQYDKDENGRHVILRFKREPDWTPPEEELEGYMGQLDYGPRVSDFYAAYRTATSICSSEDGRKNLDAARRTGQAQKIAVVRPFLSQSETAKS